MKSVQHILRSRRGVTLVEMILSMGLLCMAVAMICAVLPGAANMVRRMENLNNAQVISDIVLENIRGELEQAVGYIKVYPEGSPISGDAGGDVGTAVEYKNADGYVVLMSAEGCEATRLVRPDGMVMEEVEGVPYGQLFQRYYQPESDHTYTYQAEGRLVAGGLTRAYGDGFYNQFQLALRFAPGTDGTAITVTVTVYTQASKDTPVYADSLVVDLRDSLSLMKQVTAQ